MDIEIINYFESKAAKKFIRSIEERGFAVLENHLFEDILIDKAYELWQQFFISNRKEHYHFNRKKFDGFVPQSLSEMAKGHTVKDVKEFYNFFPFGKCPKSAQLITRGIFHTASQMATTVLQWLESNTPPEITKNFSLPLSDMVQNSARTSLRISHYPPLTGDEPAGAMRAAAHEDINLLSILPAATVGGLQIQLKNDKWLEIPVDSRLILISLGDMLSECSNGYYPATRHQVINPTGSEAEQSRLAMDLYLHPRDEVHLSRKHTAGTYLEERFREIGLI